MDATLLFVKGLKEIVEPYLFGYGFKLENLNTRSSSGGEVTDAVYTLGKKKFLIGYRYTIGLLEYRYGDTTVMHDFYLKGVGCARERKVKTESAYDLLEELGQIRSEFEYFKEDFFEGNCIKLIESARQQTEYYKDLQAKDNIKAVNEKDRQAIANARQMFRLKDYKGCIAWYKRLSQIYVLTEFDKLTLHRCNDHLKK